MDFIQTLKKIDLHCHLDGSLSEEVIAVMAKEAGVPLPQERTLLSKRLRVESDCKSLAEYLRHFDIPVACLVTEQNLERAVIDVMRQAVAENVIYIELRFAPLLSVHPGLSCTQVIESVVRGIQKGQAQYPVMANAILCAMRHDTVEDNIAMMRTGRTFLGQGICAVDLAGDEAAHPVLEQKAFFAEAKALDMPYTIHAGECGSAQSVRDAIALGAGRIGHGVAMRDDPQTRALCRREGIGIELCPISNLQTKAVSDWAMYPMRQFLDEGLYATVNTDNRTVSDTTITREMRALVEYAGLTETDLLRLVRNSVEVAFLEPEAKEKLLKKIG